MPTNTNTTDVLNDPESPLEKRQDLKSELDRTIDQKLAEKRFEKNIRNQKEDISFSERIDARVKAREQLRQQIEEEHPMEAGHYLLRMKQESGQSLTQEEKKELQKKDSDLEKTRSIAFETKGVGKTDGYGNTLSDYTASTVEYLFGEERTKDWSENKKLGVATGVTLGGVALAALGRWLWKRGTNAAEEGQQVAKKSEGGWLKKIMIGTGIGLGLFFGIPKLDQFLHRFDWYKNARQGVKDSIAEKKDAIKKKVTDKVEDGKQKVEDVKNSETGKGAVEYVKEITEGKGAAVLLEVFGDEAEAVGIQDIFDFEQQQQLQDIYKKLQNKNPKITNKILLDHTSSDIYQLLYTDASTDQRFKEKRIYAIDFIKKILNTEEYKEYLGKQFEFLKQEYPEQYKMNSFQDLTVDEVITMLYRSKARQMGEFVEVTAPIFMHILWNGDIKAGMHSLLEATKKRGVEILDHQWMVLLKDVDSNTRKNIRREKIMPILIENKKLSEINLNDYSEINEHEKSFLQNFINRLTIQFSSATDFPKESFLSQACLHDERIQSALKIAFPNMSIRDAMELYIANENKSYPAMIIKILSLIEHQDRETYTYAVSNLLGWLSKVGLYSAAKATTLGIDPIFEATNLPPEMKRIQKIIQRRFSHEMSTTWTDAKGVVTSNPGVLTGGAIVTTGVIYSLYEHWIEHMHGSMANLSQRIAIDRIPLWRRTLMLTSDYHKNIVKNLPVFRSNWRGFITSIEQIENITKNGSNLGLNSRIPSLIDEFLNSSQSAEDQRKLLEEIENFSIQAKGRIGHQSILKGTGDLYEGFTDSQLKLLSEKIDDILNKLRTDILPNKDILKHYSRFAPTRGLKNLLNITSIDEEARIGRMRVRAIKGIQITGRSEAEVLNDVLDLFKKAGKEPSYQEWIMIKNSSNAQKAIKEALLYTNDAKKIARAGEVVDIARKMAKFGATMKVLGIAGDLFSIYDLRNQQKNIQEILAKTDNKELQEVLKNQAERVAWLQSTAVLSSGGVLLHTAGVYATSHSVLASLGASGLAWGPIGIAVAAGTYTLEQAHAVEQSMSQEFGDYIKKSNEELLTELGVHPNGRSWGQIVGSALLDSSIFEGSNEYHRSQIIRAYIANNIALTPLDGESPEEYTVRNKEVVSATILSLSRQKSPDGKFINLSPDILRDAKLDGELTTLSQRLIQEEESDELTTEEKAFVMVRGTDGKEHKVFLSQYANIVDAEDGKTSTYEGVAQPFTRKDVRNAFQNNREKINMKQLFDIAKESKMLPEQLQKIMTAKALGECTDDIHFLSHAFMSFDYSGLFGWDEEMKNACLNLAERKIATIILGEVQAYCDDRTEENFVDLYQDTLKSIRNRMKQVSPESLNEELNQLKQQNIFDAFKMRDLGKMPITPESIAQRMNEKEGKKVAEKKEAEGGEKSIFTIEELKKQRVVEKKGDMYVKDAKGYRFVRVVNNSILCTEENDVIITSDDPEKIPHGTYAIFGPTETPNRNEPGTLGKFSFRNAYSDEERSVREATLNYRLKQGILRLEAAGAKKISQYCYSVNKDIQGTVIYYFDRSRMEWNITSFDSDSNLTFEQYGASYNELPKGIDPATVFSKEHVETARAMQDINQQKPATPKKAPAPSPSNPPITQPPPVISA